MLAFGFISCGLVSVNQMAAALDGRLLGSQGSFTGDDFGNFVSIQPELPIRTIDDSLSINLVHLYPSLLDDVADFNVFDGIQHGDSGFNEHILANVGLLDGQIGHAFQFVTGVFPIGFQPVLRGFNVDFRQVLADFQEPSFSSSWK